MGKTRAISPLFDASGNKNIGATIRIGREIWCLPYAGFLCKTDAYEADMSEWVTERVLREDKSHSIGLTMSDPYIMVPNEP